jgi:hypothetical protein
VGLITGYLLLFAGYCLFFLRFDFHLPYMYDYMTKLCRQQAEVILNRDDKNVRYIRQGEARHRKYKRLKLGDGLRNLYSSGSWIYEEKSEALPVTGLGGQ